MTESIKEINVSNKSDVESLPREFKKNSIL